MIGRAVEHACTEGKIRFVEMEIIENTGQNINLLCRNIISFRNRIWMMRGNCKDSRKERSACFIQLLRHVLKERLVVNAPASVEVTVVVVLMPSVISIEAGQFAEIIKAHGAVRSPVKKHS